MLHLCKIQTLFNSNELISLFTKGVGVGGGVRDKKRFDFTGVTKKRYSLIDFKKSHSPCNHLLLPGSASGY